MRGSRDNTVLVWMFLAIATAICCNAVMDADVRRDCLQRGNSAQDCAALTDR